MSLITGKRWPESTRPCAACDRIDGITVTACVRETSTGTWWCDDHWLAHRYSKPIRSLFAGRLR